METEIGLVLMKAVQWKLRALNSKKRKRVDIYVKELTRLLETHTVFTRVEKLFEAVSDGHIDRTQMKEYQKLDSTITEGIIQA